VTSKAYHISRQGSGLLLISDVISSGVRGRPSLGSSWRNGLRPASGLLPMISSFTAHRSMAPRIVMSWLTVRGELPPAKRCSRYSRIRVVSSWRTLWTPSQSSTAAKLSLYRSTVAGRSSCSHRLRNEAFKSAMGYSLSSIPCPALSYLALSWFRIVLAASKSLDSLFWILRPQVEQPVPSQGRQSSCRLIDQRLVRALGPLRGFAHVGRTLAFRVSLSPAIQPEAYLLGVRLLLWYSRCTLGVRLGIPHGREVRALWARLAEYNRPAKVCTATREKPSLPGQRGPRLKNPPKYQLHTQGVG